MPPKGYKKPGMEAQTRCASCGKLLPAAMLRGFVHQLQRLVADLSKEQPRGDEIAMRRAAQLAVLLARSTAEILIDDAETLLCEGHEPVKRGRKPKVDPSANPSEPPGVELTGVRKRKGGRPPALRAVNTDGG